MKAGTFLGGILSIPSLIRPGAAMAPISIKEVSFLNTTSTASRPGTTNPPTPAVSCFPFQDPHCCIDYAVCECANGWCRPYLPRVSPRLVNAAAYLFSGTFFAANKQYGATSLCNPPGSFAYGNDVSSLPGWCC
ncbi:hypothetical protein F5B18DRAFT_36448 [Nemania serpens]|nr:hypothetical protein F5B18DRAFT_36448 [Nemania serpens]